MMLIISLAFALCVTVLAVPVKFGRVCGRGPFGGDGGGEFSDASYAGERIKRVDLKHGFSIDGIQIQYGMTVAPYHGGPGGGRAAFTLADNAYIVEVEGRADSRRVHQLIFKDNFGNTHSFGTDRAGEIFYATGKELVYIEGKNGLDLDQITFYFNEC